jgi:hypothetical protein
VGHRRRRLGRALAFAGFVCIAAATLRPAPDPHHLVLLTPLWCLVCGDEGGADVVANLLLFLPFAIGLRLSGVSWRRVVALSAALSLTVELLQLTVIPGRDASLSDVLTNTAGGAMGAALAPHLPGLVSPAPRRARALLAVGGTVWLAVLSLAAWLLAPGLPEGRLASRWAHEVRAVDAFGGRVTDVHLDGASMPKRGVPPDSALLRRRLAEGVFSLHAEIVSGDPGRVPSWIYQLLAARHEALALYELGHRAGVAVPARGLSFRFRPVTLTVAEGLPAAAGVPVRLEAAERDRTIRLTSTYGGVRRSAQLGISPALAWVLLTPFDPPAGTALRWITAVCVAASVLPLGYWAQRSRRQVPAAAVLAPLLAAGLALVPAAGGFPPVHWSEWLGGAAGAAAGWALGPLAAYLERRCASPSDSESFSS